MKNKFLILGLIIEMSAFLPAQYVSYQAFANDAQTICAYNSKTLKTGSEVLISSKNKKPPKYVMPPAYKKESRFWNFRRKYGTLTGFSPPAGQNTYYNNLYYNNGLTGLNSRNFAWNNSMPNANNSLSTRIKRFFNPNYNNHYLNSPNYSPNIMNGNYNNLQNSRYIPLFNGNGSAGGYQNYNGINLNSNTSSTGGAAVTIID